MLFTFDLNLLSSYILYKELMNIDFIKKDKKFQNDL